MYNWNSDRKFSSSRGFSSFNFLPKNFNSLTKTSFESINYNQLPVIKEEEGNINEEEIESNSLQKLLPDSFLKKNCPKKDTPLMGDLEENPGNQERIKTAKTFIKLPPLVNINCLMNADIKQSHHIWETNFGKRLIHGKSDNLNVLDKVNSISSKEADSSKIQSCTGNSSTAQPSKIISKQNFIAGQTIRNGGGDTVDAVSQKKIARKKPKKMGRTNRNLAKKLCQETKNNLRVNETKSGVKILETSSKEKLEKNTSKQIPNVASSKEQGVEVAPTVSCFSKNRHFLTECVRSILDSTPNQLECEHCKEQFTDIEDLCTHRKQHESKKEICLLCEKVFYNPNEFVQHLLTHEGVDQFSCKKCKKYFPSLKKYKQHCREFHSVPEKTSTYQSQLSIEYVKKWLPKYECKRCKVEFDTEKAQEEHKRYHIKMDLAGAYLLSPKNLNLT